MAAATLAGVLLALSLLLFLLEVFNPGLFLAVPGATLLGASVALFVAPGSLNGALGFVGLPAIAIASAVASVVVYKRIATTSGESSVDQAYHLPGKTGVVTEPIPGGDEAGEVLINSRHWAARATEPMPEGAKVVVTAVDAHTLLVDPVDQPRP